MTFWPNAVVVPMVHPRQALTVEGKFAWGVEIDGAETAHPCTKDLGQRGEAQERNTSPHFAIICTAVKQYHVYAATDK
jgi:hypothetical protein